MNVALVSMPFYGGGRPSIQLGLLKAILDECGVVADTFHFNLDLASQLTPKVYEALCIQRGAMMGDWLFAPSAFGSAQIPSDEEYFDEFESEIHELLDGIGKDQAYLSNLRHDILPKYIDHCLREVAWDKYSLVGFTSTFQQNVASLSLARRIKLAAPNIKTVFGGSNLDGGMGKALMEAFEFIDYAVVGEAEKSLPSLISALKSCNNRPIHGVLSRFDSLEDHGIADPADLEDGPIPNYREYFERAGRLKLLDHPDYSPWVIPFESSRGCWWGQKHHCTFCGLNGNAMTFRSKSVPKLLYELSSLAERHRCTFFAASDNIMDSRYIDGLFHAIRDEQLDYEFFYEVKANLGKDDLRSLSLGGVRRIQPGIESMSSHILSLMRKGSTMLHNVRLLKWAQHYGIGAGWNILWGFPGELLVDYEEQLEVLRSISHLEPPNSAARLWLERFSPYFTDRESFPVHKVRPSAGYRHTYPADVDLDGVAYFFDYEMGSTLPDSLHSGLVEYVGKWKQNWHSSNRGSLTFRRSRAALFVDDERMNFENGTYTFRNELAACYLGCSDTMITPEKLVGFLTESGYALDTEYVRAALDQFVSLRLMLKDGNKYLSLALPISCRE